MTQRTVIELIDDITGVMADETVQFGLDKGSYEIDLSTQNAKGLREALAPYVAAGRTTRRSPVVVVKPVRDIKAIRAWAIGQGYEISTRGRIPELIVAAYDEAHS